MRLFGIFSEQIELLSRVFQSIVTRKTKAFSLVQK